MRSLLVLVVLSACGGDDPPIDIHELVGCDDAWVRNGFTECEAACVDSARALGAMGPACQAQTSSGPASCSKTFVVQGVTGCCIASRPQILFGECD